MRTLRSAAVWGVCLALLAACGTEWPPRLTDAGPRPAEIPRQARRANHAGTVLAATGRQSFEGSMPCRCVQHEDGGVQINFRTGDAEMPAVAVRIAEYGGGGAYRARLFVTGRSRAGALVTSPGDANVRVSEAAGGSAALLGGSFSGVYNGPAGKGSIEGRFDACRCPARPGASPPASLAAGP